MSTPTATELGPRGLYLGSPGRMLALPQPDKGIAPEGMRYAPLTRSLDGTGTEWFFGVKRKYAFDLPYCTPTDRRWLALCWEGAVQPLWFIDPLTPNRLPAGIASTGSTLRGERLFTSDGVVSTVRLQPDFPEAPPNSAYAQQASYLAYSGVPCVDGETLTFSYWAFGSGALTPSVTFTDVLGGTLATVNGTSGPAGGSTLIQQTLTAPVPPRAAFAALRLTQPAKGTITTSAWRLASDGGTDWTEGGGAYRVAMTKQSATSSTYPMQTISVTFEEL